MALAGAMVLSLTACGSKEDKTTTPTEAAGTTAGTEAGTTAAGAENETEAAGTTAAAASGEKLIVGTEAGFAPYEYMVGDQVVGIDMDIAQAIAERKLKTVDYLEMSTVEREIWQEN